MIKLTSLAVAFLICCGIGSAFIAKPEQPLLETAKNEKNITLLCKGIGREEIKPYYSGVTEDELEKLAVLAYLEAGGESNEIIRSVVSVVFNRLESGLWGDTLTDVIYAPGEFDPAYMIDGFDTYAEFPIIAKMHEIREIVNDIYMNGSSIPGRVMFFRTDFFHAWEGAVNEFSIGNVYFSSSVWCEVGNG